MGLPKAEVGNQAFRGLHRGLTVQYIGSLNLGRSAGIPPVCALPLGEEAVWPSDLR